MVRYLDTLCRYWLVILLPIFVFPLVEGWQVIHAPKQGYASTNIYVQPLVASVISADPAQTYLTPAQIEQANINQWLQSPTFCLTVAKGSPLYARALVLASDPLGQASADLTKNVWVTPKGDNLLAIGYTSLDPQLALQVVESVLNNSTISTQALQARQNDLNKQYYQYQLFNAQAQERSSSAQLSAYMQAHGISGAMITSQLTSDPTFATLYQQNQSDRQNVASLNATIQSYTVRNSLPSSVGDQKGYFVADPPSYSVVTNSKKKEVMSVGIALLLGLLFGGGFLVGMTALDRTVRYAEEIPTMLGLPVLAIVPQDRQTSRQPEGARPMRTPPAATKKGA